MTKSADPRPAALGNLLNGLSAEEFLRDYWQKKPLFIPAALPGFSSPLSPDELAGLACEEEVESRLVLEFAGPSPWSLEHGPFAEERFAQLPDSHWSLLVQGCDKLVPELAELLTHFDFIPHWRIDDIMASYAPAQGSVGPHLDQYDVFLIQAMGTRRWQISHAPVAEDNFLTDIELNIMRDFVAEQEWIVKPGDVLYLPPGVAHYGVALDDCITLSVGFRAPSHAEILTAFVDDAASRLNPKQRYSDPHLQLQRHAGEITPAALQQVRRILRNAVADEEAIDDWFGQYITEAKATHDTLPCPGEPLSETGNAEDFLAMLESAGGIQRNPAPRFAFIRHTRQTSLFVDGHKYPLAVELGELAALLCDRQHYSRQELAPLLQNKAALELMLQLHQAGYLLFDGMEFDIEQVCWQQAQAELRAIRSTVFIREQHVPEELEWDGLDDECRHFLARNAGGEAIGTVRLLDDGQIGRLAVLADYRGQGIGSALLQAAMEEARNRGIHTLKLNAQTSAIEFYRQHGFEVCGEAFMDAGIPHQQMILKF